MPPGMHLGLHPKARLTAEEKPALITGLDATLGQAGRGGGRRAE